MAGPGSPASDNRDSTTRDMYMNNLSARVKAAKKLNELDAKERARIENVSEKQRKNALKQLYLEEREELKEVEKERLQERLKTAREVGDEEAAAEAKAQLSKIESAEKAGRAFANGVNSIKSSLESGASSFLENYSKIAYAVNDNFNTSSTKVESLIDGIRKATTGTGIVKQQKVYENLSKLVQDGIIYNVEQRAFLQTLSDDLGMMFDASSGSLTRLINLQRQDLSSSRIAIEGSLKAFLNQNYETSQYIKDGFQSVTDSLLEAQSTMSVDAGLSLEAVTQQWLGSLSSVGLSDGTVKNLAAAIGAIGSGDIKSLTSSSVKNLIFMGAAEAGVDIGEVLNQGISADNADMLLRGITQYISSTREYDSNIVKSALANVFGYNVSDIKAASNLAESVGEEGLFANGLGITTDIEAFLKTTDRYVHTSQRIDNLLENFMYSWSSGFAVNNSGIDYMIYRLSNVITDAIATPLEGTEVAIAPFGAGVNLQVADIIRAIPLVSALPSLLGTVGDVFSGLSNSAKNNSAALGIYNALGPSSKKQNISMSGLLSGLSSTSGLSTSGSLIYNTDTGDIGKAATTSARTGAGEVVEPDTDNENSVDKLFKLVTEIKEDIKSMPDNEFIATVRLDEQHNNSVTVKGDNLVYVQNSLAVMGINVQNIYLLLLEYFTNNGAGSKLQNAYSVLDRESASSLGWAVDTSGFTTL